MKTVIGLLLSLLLLCFITVEAKDKDKKYRGIDIEPPTGKIQIIPPIKGEYVNFTITATDSNSGVSTLCISNFETQSCSPRVAYNGSPRTINWMMLPGTGMRTIYIYVMDVAGKTELTKILILKEE